MLCESVATCLISCYGLQSISNGCNPLRWLSDLCFATKDPDKGPLKEQWSRVYLNNFGHADLSAADDS